MAKKSGKTNKRKNVLKVIKEKNRNNIKILKTNLDRALENKNVKEAFRLCGYILEHSDFDFEHFKSVIIQTYELRIAEAISENKKEYALKIYSSIIDLFPEIEAAFSISLKINIEIHSEHCFLLSKYETDVLVRENIDDFIINELNDIRIIADKKFQDNNSTLKIESNIILDAWKEVEDNSVVSNSAYEMMLKNISRKSPLRYWRLFVQALKAFYNNENAAALKCISKIVGNSPVYKIAAVLKNLIDNTDNELTKHLKRKIFEHGIREELSIIDDEFEKGFYISAALRMSRIIKSKFFNKRSVLLRNLLAAFFINMPEEFSEEKEIITILSSNNAVVVHGLLLIEYYCGRDDAEDWEEILEEYPRLYSDIEKALILSRIAVIKLEEMEDEEDFFLPAFLRPRQRYTKEEKKYEYLNKAKPLWERSIKLYPLKETFEVWGKFAQKVETTAKYEKILEDWHELFPEDESVLLQLVSSCRERKVYTKAEKYCSKLRNLIPGHPKLKLLDECLVLETAIHHFKNERYSKCFDLVNETREMPEKFLSVLRIMLLLIAKKKIDKNVQVKEEQNSLQLIESPFLIYYITNILADKFNCDCGNYVNSFNFIKRQLKNSDICIKSLYDCLCIQDSVWNSKHYIPVFIKNGNLRNPTLSSGFLYDFVLKIIEKFGAMVFFLVDAFLWDITGEVLNRNDRFAAHFLFLRAYIIIENYHYTKHSLSEQNFNRRVGDVISAAISIASNYNDSLLIQYFKNLFGDLWDFDNNEKVVKDLSEADINRIIKKEAKQKILSLRHFKRLDSFGTDDFVQPDLFSLNGEDY